MHACAHAYVCGYLHTYVFMQVGLQPASTGVGGERPIAATTFDALRWAIKKMRGEASSTEGNGMECSGSGTPLPLPFPSDSSLASVGARLVSASISAVSDALGLTSGGQPKARQVKPSHVKSGQASLHLLRASLVLSSASLPQVSVGETGEKGSSLTLADVEAEEVAVPADVQAALMELDDVAIGLDDVAMGLDDVAIGLDDVAIGLGDVAMGLREGEFTTGLEALTISAVGGAAMATDEAKEMAPAGSSPAEAMTELVVAVAEAAIVRFGKTAVQRVLEERAGGTGSPRRISATLAKLLVPDGKLEHVVGDEDEEGAPWPPLQRHPLRASADSFDASAMIESLAFEMIQLFASHADEGGRVCRAPLSPLSPLSPPSPLSPLSLLSLLSHLSSLLSLLSPLSPLSSLPALSPLSLSPLSLSRLI